MPPTPKTTKSICKKCKGQRYWNCKCGDKAQLKDKNFKKYE